MKPNEPARHILAAQLHLNRALAFSIMAPDYPESAAPSLTQEEIRKAIRALEFALSSPSRLRNLELRVNAIEDRLGPEPWLDASQPNGGEPCDD